MSDKEQRLAIRVSTTLVKKLDARAKYLRGKLGYSISRSDVARGLIQEGLKQPEKK